MKIFDDLNGEFVARLREISSTTRTTADGKASITFRTARIETAYSPTVIKKLEAGRLIAIPNVMSVGTNDTYSIYEIADVYPMHYSMLTLDRSQPGAIRKEFMTLIDKEWEKGSKSTWIEIVGAPAGYVMQTGGGEPKFIRKNLAPLAGSQVKLLDKETIQKFICYTSETKPENYTIGSLLGVADDHIPFTVHLEKLLHYHVGAFAFTGSGKSNLTSLVMRKSLATVPDVKFVIFDVSSEYGINLLDLLKDYPSRIVFTEPLQGKTQEEKTEDYMRRHVIPEALEEKKKNLAKAASELIKQDKIRTISLSSESEDAINMYRTYGGIIGVLADLVGERYGSAASKMLAPTIIDSIKEFIGKNGLNYDSLLDDKTITLLDSIDRIFHEAQLAANDSLMKIFRNLRTALTHSKKVTKAEYVSEDLVNEIMNNKEDSPKIFVINLPEVEDARIFCTGIINNIFRRRKNSFNLKPRIVFVFDEAQEFIPQDKKREDGTESSSRSVERLLRHGRKYHLSGWVSTQRIAHLNTNALQQLHSYFVSTMPRPYDRQLISDTFAIDDAFMDRTLMFQNGDWLMTSFKATNTQNVPVFFHAENNEDYLRKLYNLR